MRSRNCWKRARGSTAALPEAPRLLPLACAAVALVAGTAAHGQVFSANSGDFVVGAELCVTILSDGHDPATFLGDAGWEERGTNPIGTSYIHEDYGVQIIVSQLLGTPSCQVDGYLADEKSRDELDEMIEASLSEHFGERLQNVHRDETVPGAGYLVDQTLGALSFEQRAAGLSTRFTSMNLPEN